MRKQNLFFILLPICFLFFFFGFNTFPYPINNYHDQSFAEVSNFQKADISKNTSNDCHLVENDSLVNLYKDVVFNNANCGVFDPVITKQWNSKIIVYIDKSIPLEIEKKFKNYYNEVKNVNNFKLQFTNNKEKANYLISSTEEDLLTKMGISEKDETYTYSHVYYNLFTDNNSKFYGGKMTVNLKAIRDKKLILPKLKQLFFFSLGQFTLDKKVRTNSLLSSNYNNSDVLSQSDLKLLKLHYLQIHDKPLSCSSYNKFINNQKSICKNEN